MADGGFNLQNFVDSHVDIINNIANSMGPVQQLLTGFAYLAGLMFCIKAFMSLKHYGESKTAMSAGSASIKEPIIYLLVGAILLYFPSALKIFLTTSFGYDSILQYRQITTDNLSIGIFNTAAGRALARIIQTIGGVAFIRGWVLIARAASQGQQPGGTGKGMVHVIGGILAMNIIGTLEIINNTMYGT